MGCYPLFTCRNWEEIENDLLSLSNDLVSLAVVIDPFGHFDEVKLRRWFPDAIIPFKEHFVTELSRSVEEVVSKHHRYYTRKALAELHVEAASEPFEHLDDWTHLYGHLVDRHGLRGVKAFSKKAFAVQLSVPGLVFFRAMHKGEAIGMHLWYVQGEVAYSHLAAFNDRGYELMAAYALYWRALEHFTAAGVRWLDLGGGAGLKRGSDGLSQFKRGWATDSRTAWFGGRIFNRSAYDQLTRDREVGNVKYFPAYRDGELA
jgi:hypothetical protein